MSVILFFSKAFFISFLEGIKTFYATNVAFYFNCQASHQHLDLESPPLCYLERSPQCFHACGPFSSDFRLEQELDALETQVLWAENPPGLLFTCPQPGLSCRTEEKRRGLLSVSGSSQDNQQSCPQPMVATKAVNQIPLAHRGQVPPSHRVLIL